MTTLSEHLLAEYTTEVAATRRVFDRIPEDKLSWKPHPKSMSLGQLGNHIAHLTGGVAMLISESPRQAPNFPPEKEAGSRAEMHAGLDWSVATVTKALATWGDAGLAAEWKMLAGEQAIITLPRYQMLRAVLLNHWYHHRGEMMVYLRMLDIPVPSIYGPSADENPFG